MAALPQDPAPLPVLASIYLSVFTTGSSTSPTAMRTATSKTCGTAFLGDIPTYHLQQINNANGHGGSVAGDTYIACPQATAAAVGDLFVSVYNDQQHFAYRDANGNIQDVWYGTGGWKLQQINNANGHGGSVAGDTYIACPQATAAAVGDLFVSVYNDQQHFAYRDANGNIGKTCGTARAGGSCSRSTTPTGTAAP